MSNSTRLRAALQLSRAWADRRFLAERKITPALALGAASFGEALRMHRHDRRRLGVLWLERENSRRRDERQTSDQQQRVGNARSPKHVEHSTRISHRSHT